MQVRAFTAYVLRVPLRRPFRHASAERSYSDNLLVRAETTEGIIGWGEGVPREYVTGETAEGAISQFAATDWASQLGQDIDSWQDVIELCDSVTLAEMAENARGCYGNSLRCAVELSLLDAYGQLRGESLRAGLAYVKGCADVMRATERVRYSTTIDAEHSRKLWRSALKMRAYRFRQCKVKVGADGDAERLAIVRRWIGPHIDLRVDANEAWRGDTAVGNVNALLPSNISCVEQPVPHEELSALAEIRGQIETPVMLDESLTSMHDAEQAVGLSACDLFNIRLSKCGGMLASLRLAAYARQHGIGYQLGCHPGETGILSAAGRHFATAVGEIRYLEGSYDRHVLAESIAQPDMTFGYGGWAPALQGPGLGASISLQSIQHLIRGHHAAKL